MVMPRSRSRSMESRTCSIISRCEQRAGDLEQPVGQRRFAVIDVRDDREIADEFAIHEVWEALPIIPFPQCGALTAFGSWNRARLCAGTEHRRGGDGCYTDP